MESRSFRSGARRTAQRTSYQPSGGSPASALGPQYYEDGHIPGAINIPHTEVQELAPSLLPDKDAPIVVYCASGPCQNSDLAARQLERLGYTNVRDYHEGKAEWVAAGHPLESGVAV